MHILFFVLNSSKNPEEAELEDTLNQVVSTGFLLNIRCLQVFYILNIEDNHSAHKLVL